MLCYKTHVDGESMYNTPPCYTIYVLGKVLKWIEDLGAGNHNTNVTAEQAEAAIREIRGEA